MGCWNETCMISGLPIRENQKVKLLFLTTFDDGLSKVIGLPINGEYNDYGSIKNYDVNDKDLELTRSNINVRLANDVIKSFETILENEELELNQFGMKAKLNKVMILKEVWDFSVEFAKKSKHLYGESTAYEEYIKRLNKYNEEKEEFRKKLEKEDGVTKSQYNMLAELVRHPLHDTLPSNINETIDEHIESVEELYFVNIALQITRKAWHTTAGTGTGDQNYEGCITFYDGLKTITKTILNDHNTCNGDDFRPDSELYSDFKNGLPLDNDELKHLEEVARNAYYSICNLGPRFALAAEEACHTMNAVHAKIQSLRSKGEWTC